LKRTLLHIVADDECMSCKGTGIRHKATYDHSVHRMLIELWVCSCVSVTGTKRTDK